MLSDNPSILVAGANGQVGRCLQRIASKFSGYDFHFLGREHLPLDNHALTREIIKALKPQYIINTAAYTAVDKAETEQELARNVNGYAVGNIAKYCNENGIHFIHISTDYVFDGMGTRPYQENDPTHPVNAYGASKLLGEELALKEHPETIVIRTSWVYSMYGSNFVKTMMRLMAERTEVKVVNDQHGAPTFAMDLADAIMQIISGAKWKGGIYHFSNRGDITWFEFASFIQKTGNYVCKVLPITTEQFPTPAQRPRYSVLDCSKIERVYKVQIRDWKESLLEMMSAVKD
jgi:dTDP-4-dehydrorhamnose reductase